MVCILSIVYLLFFAIFHTIKPYYNMSHVYMGLYVLQVNLKLFKKKSNKLQIISTK